MKLSYILEARPSWLLSPESLMQYCYLESLSDGDRAVATELAAGDP